ncbi:hypothetical protein SEVIR_3G058400v4 [Setaria viridis]|uniref:Uncharacterized protein n=2 Tax=Setaria TaxID=4554 RepID=K3ZB44_SETIT|nr:hypothetical protein SETIT_3G057500v2 [Setaria italica]TKW24560.1 hypothetical protein SEVIR_3G058400v2 [Setaria viridis]
MWRGAYNKGSAGVVVDGEIEVHVERVEKIEVVMNGTPSPTTTTTTTTGVVLPPPPGNVAGRSSPTATVSGKAVVAPDVNELAEEFIRRNRAAFQGQKTM